MDIPVNRHYFRSTSIALVCRKKSSHERSSRAGAIQFTFWGAAIWNRAESLLLKPARLSQALLDLHLIGPEQFLSPPLSRC